MNFYVYIPANQQNARKKPGSAANEPALPGNGPTHSDLGRVFQQAIAHLLCAGQRVDFFAQASAAPQSAHIPGDVLAQIVDGHHLIALIKLGKQLGMKPEEVFRLSDFSKDDFLEMMIQGRNTYSKAEMYTTI